MATRLFTTQAIRALQPGPIPYKVCEAAPRGEGRLIVRVHPTGLKEFYFRTRVGNADQLIRIGRFEQTPGYGGMSLKDARAELARLVEIQRSTGDVKAELARREEVANQERDARARAARLGSFEQLLDAYVADLRARERVSTRYVESAFQRSVKTPFVALCRKRAKEIGPADIQQILARLVGRGLRRQVNLVRSYLSAAFQHGAKSDHDPTRVTHDSAVFEIVSNPVSLVPRKAEFERVGERVLSKEELARYWHGLDKAIPVVAAFLRFDLALGGQRGIQLLRPSWRDYDFDANTVLLRDGKGRGGTARDHLLPLTKQCLDILAPLRELNADCEGPFASRGAAQLHPSTISKSVREIWESLAAEDVARGVKEPIPRFSFRDIRRTCETHLASLGVSREIRAQLLSHGRSGVQARHYDRYSYLEEKRRALLKWNRYLERVVEGRSEAKAADAIRKARLERRVASRAVDGGEIQP